MLVSRNEGLSTFCLELHFLRNGGQKMTNDQIKRKRIVKLMGELRQICVDTDFCDECPFQDGKGVCFFNIGKSPANWYNAIEIIKDGRENLYDLRTGTVI